MQYPYEVITCLDEIKTEVFSMQLVIAKRLKQVNNLEKKQQYQNAKKIFEKLSAVLQET